MRNREVRFLCRPIVIADEVDVRKFFTFDKNGRLAAFGFFDPVYDNGSIAGYLTAFKRYRPGEETLLGHAINHHVLETLRGEGISSSERTGITPTRSSSPAVSGPGSPRHAGWKVAHLGDIPDELVAARIEGSFDTRARERVPDTTVAVVRGRPCDRWRSQ